MINISILSLKKKFSIFFYITSFIIFLYPFSISGLSANYSFIFFPFLFVLLSGKIKRPSENIIKIVLFFFLILIVSVFYQYELFKYIDRRLISFLIFISMFSFVVIDVDKNKIDAFKIAVVLIVLYFVVLKVGNFFIYSAAEKGNLKFYVGSSRYGFVYLLAFWIVFLYKPTSKFFYTIKFSTILLILAGIFVTYSRTTIVAFLFSFAIYYFGNFFLLKKKFISKLILIIFTPIVFIMLYSYLDKLFPNTSLYFSKTLFTYFSLDGLNLLIERFTNYNTSEGFRVYLLGKILNFVSFNPFTGSGFLGCWIMFDDLKCSAHNQYGDVLFRTGFIGLFIYLYLLYKVFIHLKNNHRDLFYGYISILVYGFFHETFKMSQGAFILAFVLGMMVTANRYKTIGKNRTSNP